MLSDGPIFTDVCCDWTSLEKFNRLIDEGFMCMLIPKRTQIELNVSNVDIQNGDFVQNQLQDAVDKDAITYEACKEIVAQGQDRNSWLVFASGVQHSEHIAQCLQSLGVSALAVHSKMDDAARDKAIRDFKAGNIQCVVNNNVLTTGFDHPGIDLIAMLRPTTSTVLWVQMLGRGTRPCPEAHKENCLVLDFAGNTKRLGPINDPVIPRKRNASDGNGVAPIKICELCGTYNHARATECIDCKAKFEMVSKLTQVASTEDLIKREIEQDRIEEVEVSRAIYRRHQKNGSLPVMEVAYICGLKQHNEFVCLQHDGLAGRKARSWWHLRVDAEPPKTVDQALQLVQGMKVPKRIRLLWKPKAKYAEVIATIF
jgi:DNA repair protein RadD